MIPSELQTTYENFRYRYDKKENPYNRGIMWNIVEIFFSRIPNSMNNFRLLVEDEEMGAPPENPHLGDAFVSSKEKIDIEMGAKLCEDRNYSLPEILRNLDYDDDSDDNSKTKEEEGRTALDASFHHQQDVKESFKISIVDGFENPEEESIVRNGKGESVLDFNVGVAVNESTGRFSAKVAGAESAPRSNADDGGSEYANKSISEDGLTEAAQHYIAEDRPSDFIDNLGGNKTSPVDATYDNCSL